MQKLKFYRIHGNAELPKYATQGSACFDLSYSPENKESKISVFQPYGVSRDRPVHAESLSITVMPGERALLPTGLIADIPEGYSIRIHPRSSVSIKKGLSMPNSEGVIDSDYVHEMFLSVINTTENKIEIMPGDRIAQAELVPVIQCEISEIKKAPAQKKDRKGGIGSTGV